MEQEPLPYFNCCGEWQEAHACKFCGKEFAVIVVSTHELEERTYH